MLDYNLGIKDWFDNHPGGDNVVIKYEQSLSSIEEENSDTDSAKEENE